MRQYNEEIDKTIIEILHEKGPRTFGKLKEDVEKSIKHTISFETYAIRLNAMIKPAIKKSRYTIQPVLQKIDEGRGKNVFYSLTKEAKIRYDLKLPIMKDETTIEKAYRLLFYYIVFFYNQTIKLKDEDEYNGFLEKLRINENELKFSGNSKFKEFKITKWIHPDSEIQFTRKDFLHPSGKKGENEYSYMLPGISPVEYKKIREPGLIYQGLNFKKHQVTHYFELLEKQNLIKKIKSKELVYLDEERYTIVDNSLRELLADCWTLQSHVYTYLEYIWTANRKPTNEERIYDEHLRGKNRSNRWFIECNNTRRDYKKKNKKQITKETQEMIDWGKSEIIKKFNSIQNEYAKLINDYSYFIKPLLNIVYPEFLRNENETI